MKTSTGSLGFCPTGLVTLVSDFGVRDGYVGAMKGVMLSIAGDLRLCDVAHGVPPQSVVAGAMAMHDAAPWFAPGTTHLAVVDPGVGTARAAIVGLAGGHAFVGPDNGLFSLVWQELGGLDAAYRVDEHPFLLAKRSVTFHGRDVFAPTAAAIAAGLLEPADVGPPIEPVRLVLPMVSITPDRIRGEVLYCDRFGNAVTNVDGELVEQLGRPARVRLPTGRVVKLVRTYGDVAPGAPIALVGSTGRLEVAVREGSAASLLGLQAGMSVELTADAGS